MSILWKNKLLAFGMLCLIIAVVLVIIYFITINEFENRIEAIARVEKDKINSNEWLKTLEEGLNNVSVSATNHDAIISTERRVSHAAVHQIHGPYLAENGINIYKGRYFLEDEGIHQPILLDKALAFEMFRTYNCIGERVYIEGKTYTVCGITDGLEDKYKTQQKNAYIPFKQLIEDHYITVISPSSGHGIRTSKKLKVYMDMLGKNTLNNTYIYKARYRFRMYLVLSIYSLVVAIIIAIAITRSIKKLHEQLRERLESVYFKDVWFKYMLRIGLHVIVFGVVIFMVYYVVRGMSETAWAFGEMLPESLIDWSAIKDCILRIQIRKNVQFPVRTTIQIRMRNLWCYIILTSGLLGGSLVCYGLWTWRNKIKDKP